MSNENTEKNIDLTLLVWRQPNAEAKGKMQTYPAKNISTDMSFLEMLDVVNEGLIKKDADPIEFDSDCREGICGTCGLVINGQAHGPQRATTVCQLHMRHFKNGDKIYIEPLRALAFPVVKDLVIDRSAFDRIIMAGGFISVNTGGTLMLIPFLFQRRTVTLLWILPRVSAAVLVLPRVLMHLHRYLHQPKLHIWQCFHKVRLNESKGLKTWLTRWTKRVLVIVLMSANAKPLALKRYLYQI